MFIFGKYKRGDGIMTENMGYRLEITMEARSWARHHYIKRSFPVKTGRLDIGKYGYPYCDYNSIEMIEIAENKQATNLKLKFDHEDVTVILNTFTTVRRGGETHIDAYMKVPVTTPLVHTTFYLYVE